MKQRTNQEWLDGLSRESADSVSTAEDLRVYLERALAKVLRQKTLARDDIADLAQEALLRIVTQMNTFRGDSAFTTWAVSVATRTAFTELRKRKVRERTADEFKRAERDALLQNETPATDDLVSHAQLLTDLQRAIDTQLSERQRVAVLAELRGLPTIEIAEQLATNQNALYKLVHDARLKLRAALLTAGHTAETIGEQIQGASKR